MALQYHIIPVTPFAQNATLLWCTVTGQAAIVDAGGDIGQLAAAVRERGLTLEKLLLTHGHIDHAGGAAELAGEFGVKIEGPEHSESYWLDILPHQGRMFGFPPSDKLTPDRWLAEGDTVTVGEQVLEVRHCPGHTPGHVVFYSREAGMVIVGDVLFQGSIGRTDFPMGNHQQLLDAIRSKLFVLPDETVVLPGHGPATTIGEEKRHNPFVSDARYR